jgi:hypothetical protein
VEKYCRAEQAVDNNMTHAHCMLNNLDDRHARTHTVFITYCFSAVTIAARTRLNITLYAHCLSCQIFLCYIYSGVYTP